MRTEQIKDKRSQLIDTALQLFYSHGIHAIGINEILATSGIAKKTLYNHFSSKEDLIQACVIERDKRFMQWMESQCHDCKSEAALIEQLFDGLHLWINNKVELIGSFEGCFFVNTAAEYGDPTNEIYQLCLQHKMNIKKFILEKLTLMSANQQHINRLTDLLILLKEGAINSAYVMNDKEAALKAKPLALTFIEIS